ncbi:ATP-binding protein [bacterium]|nr:ATP-binding protein [bacterium]
MIRTKKVITSVSYRTSESSVFLNADSRDRGILIGSRIGESNSISGYIGKVVEQSSGSSLLDYGVWCDLSFPHVIGIFGTRGTGKSFDLGVFVECVSGLEGIVDGPPPQSTVVVFDVQNQFWTLALSPNPNLPEDKHHLANLNLWDLKASTVLNVRLWLPYGCKSTLPGVLSFRIAPQQLQNDDWLALLELDRYSAIGQALLALLADCGSLEPAELVTALPTSSALNSFQQSTMDALLWRLQGLAETNLVGLPGIDVEQLLMPGQVSVLLLRELPEGLRSLVVGVLVRIMSSRMGSYHQARRVARRYDQDMPGENLPERLWVVLDEAHVVVPRQGSTAATVPVVDYVKRGRDAGLSMIFATQQPAAVDNRLMSQVDMTLTHALGFESDLQAAIARMPTRTSVTYERGGFQLPSLGDTLRSLEPGETIIADSANGRVFIARIRPRLSAHGGHTPPLDQESE